MKTLVVGWFSFEQCGATAGDLMVRDIVCEWLEQIGHDYDVALAPPFSGGVNCRLVDPRIYSHVVFACGPFPYDENTSEFLQRFKSCRLIGLNLSMIEPLDVWNPFDVLLERDSSAGSRPDISFLSRQKQVPVVGIILLDSQYEYQPEYKNKAKHKVVNELINRLIASQEMVAVTIDTSLDTCLAPNRANLRSEAEVESLIARMDLVITNRLHGSVLALKNAVPAIAIDAITGGAKVLRQAKTIGWSTVFTIDTLTDEALREAFEYCQTETARAEVRECRERAIKLATEVRDEFMGAISVLGSSNSRIDLPYKTQNQSLSEPSYSLTKQVTLWIKALRSAGKRALLGVGKRFLKYKNLLSAAR